MAGEKSGENSGDLYVVTDSRLCDLASEECVANEDPDVMDEYCAENSDRCPAKPYFDRGKDLCEFAGGCELFKRVEGQEDEDAYVQIGDICLDKATRVGESCYKNKLKEAGRK